MKKTDLIGIGYIVGVVILIFVIFKEQFIWATIHYPYPMGFLKVAALATFGECLKMRLKTGSWRITRPVQRFIVWGLFGFWFTAAFQYCSDGTAGIMVKNLWPVIGFTESLKVVWIAFSKSLWINLGGCFAYTMMLVHEYINQMIDKQGLLSQEEFRFDKKVWVPDGKHLFSRASLCTIPWIIVWFWLPMHTITFTLPGHFRVLSAAFLAVALGFILTIKKA